MRLLDRLHADSLGLFFSGELVISLTEEEVQVIERATRHDERIQKSPGGPEADVRDGLFDIMNDLRLYEL